MKLSLKTNAIKSFGKTVENDIKSLEKVLNIKFPNDYKDFLLKTNGGSIPNDNTNEIVLKNIKKIINNPLSIQYKNYQYEDCINGNKDVHIDISYEDNYYESSTGLPDLTWISGQSCSDIFNKLTPFQRKILIKYYLEDWNDRQIAENMGAHINTVNQKRRDAIDLLCTEMGISKEMLKRSRKSGKKASLPMI